jgi:hypothetical protein
MQLQRLFLPSCPSDLELSTVLVDDVLYPDIDVEDVQEPDFLLCLDGFDELDNCVSKKGVNKGFRRGVYSFWWKERVMQSLKMDNA